MGVSKLVTAVLLTVLGAAGTFNGISLVSDPTGRSLGLRVDMLPAWHTWDYRVSGAFVLLALGLVPLICAAAVLVDVRGATTIAGFIGMIAAGWVVWQIVVLDIRAPRAQYGLGVLAGLLIVSGISARRKRRHRSRRAALD